MLVACESGGGGSDPVGWLITLAVLAIVLAVTIPIFKAARDRTERRLLLGLLIGSIVLGPLIIAAFYAGFFGDDSNVGKLAVLLLIPGVLGAAIARLTKAAHSGRAFLISTWGGVSLIGAAMVLFFLAFAVGGACLE
ncbi:MAG: hypothetical protein ACTHLH_01840 [Solirubrobacterales bacterium]